MEQRQVSHYHLHPNLIAPWVLLWFAGSALVVLSFLLGL